MAPKFATPKHDPSPPALPPHECLAKRSGDGKATLSLSDHHRLVGAVARELYDRLPPPVKSLISPGVITLAALHDIGKASPGFQAKIRSEDAGGFETNHALIGEAALQAYYRLRIYDRIETSQSSGWPLAVGLHHGSRDWRELWLHDNPRYGGKDWAERRLEILDQSINDWGEIPKTEPSPFELFMAVGFVCIADWIASDERYFPIDALPSWDELRERVREVLDEIGFVWPAIKDQKSFEELFGFSPNEVQQAAYELAKQPGLLVIEAPMGLGKTEAALWAAYRLIASGHNHGIYFALPTRVTSNVMYRRIQLFLRNLFGESVAARLVHSYAWLAHLLAGGEELCPGGSWFAPAKRALLWPMGVGTIDQSLLGVINVKHHFLRLFGLAGKVVILDEVHSYDVFTGTLLDKLIEFLLQLRCSVIILSATLTKRRREELGCPTTAPEGDSYPVILHGGGDLRAVPAPQTAQKRVQLRLVNEKTPAFWDEIADRLTQGQAILAIMNTVAEAQEFYRQAKSSMAAGQATIGLLHSQYVPGQRQEAEEFWVKKLGKAGTAERGASLLVGTQVLEQSLDIDSDLLITALAPTDILFQRLGRLWRHACPSRPARAPECWLLDRQWLEADDKKDFLDRIGPTQFVYAPYVLWRTIQILSDHPELELPGLIRPLLERTYVDCQQQEPAWVEELRKELEKQKERMRNLAISLQNFALPCLRNEEIQTRYVDLPSESVLILRSIDRGPARVKIEPVYGPPIELPLRAVDRAALAPLHLNMLDVRSAWLTSVRASLPDCLKPFLDSTVRVLYLHEDGRLLDSDGTDSGLTYTTELGLFRREATSLGLRSQEVSHELQFD